MSKLPEKYLLHILDEVNYLLDTSSNLTEPRFSQDPTLQRAYSRSLEIIGEATKNIPDEFKQQHPHIDWKGMAGMRDRLIHGYFGVDYHIVWDVVRNELPHLKTKIAVLVGNK